MAGRHDHDLDEQLNLYLDGLLTEQEREEFESRLGSDHALRRAVEFHRGLTLEFREEAPPLPRGFAGRARRRLEEAEAGPRAEGASPPSATPVFPLWRSAVGLRVIGAVAAMLTLALVLWPYMKRGPEEPPPGLGTGLSERDGTALRQPPGFRDDVGAGEVESVPDEETLEALRSLGYLASGKEGAVPPEPEPEKGTARRGLASRREPNPPGIPAALEAVGAEQPKRPSAAGPERAEVARVEAERRAEAAPPPVAIAAAEEAEPPPRRAPAEPRPPFRVAPARRAPELGRDHEVVRSQEAWSTLVAAAGGRTAGIDFEAEMAILLRDDLGSDPPARLRVVSVRWFPGSIRITVERVPSGTEGPASPGQAVILPASELPVHILVR
ncbi:MAG: hypothetical protein ACE5JH_07400 [Acidobacteriota bacterium]